MPFGTSFMPGEDSASNDPLNGQARAQSPYQSAIKILSLRLPKFLGGAGLAPGPLLNSPGAMGSAPVPPMGGAMGGPQAPMQSAPPNSALAQMYAQLSGMGAQTPRVVPGLEQAGMVPQSPVQREALPWTPSPAGDVKGGPELYPGPGTGSPFGAEALHEILRRKYESGGGNSFF